jgi:hypothetical protein
MGASASSTSASSGWTDSWIQCQEKVIHIDCCSMDRKLEEQHLRSSSRRSPDSKSSTPGSRQNGTGNEKRDSLSSIYGGMNAALRGTKSAPAWLKDPPPMQGWTVEDQRVLLSKLEELPNARKGGDHLKIVLDRTHKEIPHKSIDEIAECFKYIERTQIAFFGPNEKNSESVKNSSSSMRRPSGFSRRKSQ